jgi:hypothetical protein
MMNILKNLFGGGGGGGNRSADGGMYFYVRPRGCEEVVQVRINPSNDLSLEGDAYFVRKIARGTHRCFNPVELTLTFDKNRKLISSEVDKGEIVDEAAYNEWQEQLTAKKAAMRAHNAAVDEARAEADEG